MSVRIELLRERRTSPGFERFTAFRGVRLPDVGFGMMRGIVRMLKFWE